MRIKYIPTGNVFDLPEAEARRIYIEDKGFNYEVLDGKIEIENENVEKTSVYNKIVEEDKQEEEKDGENEKSEEKSLESYTVPELKAKLDELNIEYPKNAKKAELIALLNKTGDNIEQEEAKDGE